MTEQASDDRPVRDHVGFVMYCSADMLEDIKVPWVILGHSERRSLLKESEEVSPLFDNLFQLS